MKRFSAQYIITNSSPTLKRAVITTADDGTIINIEENQGDLKEIHSVEFYNGIIVPGFVNCHCHLELSHIKGNVSHDIGLDGFIEQIRNIRDTDTENTFNAIKSADNEMAREGVVLCADICNSSLSFDIKKESRIKYINLLEVFGLDPEKASRRMDELMKVGETAKEMDLPYFFVPHSAYSMSLSLLRLLKVKSRKNIITSVHFLEAECEKTFLKDHSGPLRSSYEHSGLIPPRLETVKSHVEAVLNEITPTGNLILVHNTFADKSTIENVTSRKNLYWCVCPNSNIYIEDRVPPLNLLREEKCEIVIGTDSLASNNRLSIIEELKTLQSNFPRIPIEELVGWATMNGAKALGEEDHFGKIETGKKPGLLLIQNVDLVNLKLLPDSFVTRLI